GGVETRRTKVRRELAVVEAPLERLGPAAPEKGGPPARRRFAVEEDGKLQLGADPAGDDKRALARAVAVGWIDRHDGNDVGGADARMGAFMRTQIDALARAGHTGDQGGDERILLADEREDGAVVIRVRVDVEQLRRPREG